MDDVEVVNFNGIRTDQLYAEIMDVMSKEKYKNLTSAEIIGTLEYTKTKYILEMGD